ncbi:MAG TPA: lamin tail domain-containing protein, partial [Verrucomicrobiales bacterium]|nr:lamin tail domain-containing protein [Verrucomicrobiales bacterium]
EFSGWLDGPTRAAPNPGFAPARVVINEIHYHPVSDDEAETFVELHNPGSEPVDLAYWEFVEGITFVFPPGALLPEGGYAVLAKDRDRLKILFPDLPDGAVFGNFNGSLARGGERLVLMEPAGAGGVLTEAATVAYADGGRWGRWADGGGSSLELADPRAGNALGPNWADSAEAAEAGWTLVERTGLLHNGSGRADQLQMFLMGPGEALVDDVEVLNEAGENLLVNGTFDQGTTGWFFQGTHRLSEWRDSGGTGDSGCLLVRAAERGDIGANRIRAPLRSALISGRLATLRAKVRWLRGHPEILLRTKGNYLEVVGSLAAPAGSGTPGAPNSRASGNAGPAILNVKHEPLLPRTGENVRVTALVSDPDGLDEVRLRYRVDPSGLPLRVTMSDDGTGGDAAPGDSVFTGTIPGQPSGALVAFQVEAADAAEPAAESRFPAGDGREALVRFGEAAYGGGFTHYRLWMTVRDRDRWSDREKMSNEPVPVTFIDDRSERAIYEAGSWYSGSAYSSPAYTAPDGILCGYDVVFPADEPFLGGTELTLDFPVRDPTAQREQLMFWFCDQLGLPNNHRRYVHLFVNGVGNRSRSGFGAGANAIYEDVQQPGRDMIEQWFPGGEDGTLIKGDYWHEFDDGGARIDPAVAPALAIYTRPDGSWNTERYRWVWRPRARRGRPDDFSSLFRLATVVNLEGAAYDAAVPAVVDLNNWMRTFAANDLAANWDSFGNPGAKNTFHYLPPGGRWRQMSWDFDVGIGVFNNPVQASLFNGSDPAINDLQRSPAWERAYWSALAEAVGGFFQPEAVRPLLQVKYDALRAAGAPVVSPFVPSGQEGLSIPGWIEGRRTFLLEEMAGRGLDTRFSITTNFGLNFSTERNLVRLAGKAPLSAQGILVNERPYPESWSATDTWNIEVALAPGANRLEVMGADAQNRPVEGLSDSITVTVTGPVDVPEGKVVFNEIQYHPADGDNEFLEIFNRSETTAFDLGGWRVGGVDFTFSAPVLLEAGGYLLLVRDRGLFAEEHGWEIPVAGVFPGRLDNAGETLRLVKVDSLTGEETLIDQVSYDDAAPWPTEADGGGPSLQLRNGAVETNAPSSWAAASGERPYSPGAVNTVPPMPGPSPLPDLELTVERASGAPAFVSFLAPAGFRYRVEWSDSMENPGPWPVVGEEIAGRGVRATVEDAAAAGLSRRFYRVRVQRDEDG